MNIYSIYVNLEKEGEPFISIQNGFSLTAAIFGFLWLLYHKVWNILLITTVIYTIIFLQNEKIANGIMSLLHIINIFVFGMFATDIREYNLEKKGYKLRDIILAPSIIESEIKFLTRLGGDKIFI